MTDQKIIAYKLLFALPYGCTYMTPSNVICKPPEWRWVKHPHYEHYLNWFSPEELRPSSEPPYSKMFLFSLCRLLAL